MPRACLVLMSSAAVAVVIDEWRTRSGPWPVRMPWGFVVAMIVFFYTTVAVIIEKPDGIKIAGAFIASILVFSFISRLQRSKELRFEKFEFVDEHSRFLWDALRHLEFPVLVPHRPGHHTIEQKDERMRRVHRLDEQVPIVFVEAVLGDTSEFEQNPLLEVVQEEGRFIVRLRRCVSIAHAVATVALELSKDRQAARDSLRLVGRKPAGRQLELPALRRRQRALAGPRVDRQGRARFEKATARDHRVGGRRLVANLHPLEGIERKHRGFE